MRAPPDNLIRSLWNCFNHLTEVEPLARPCVKSHRFRCADHFAVGGRAPVLTSRGRFAFASALRVLEAVDTLAAPSLLLWARRHGDGAGPVVAVSEGELLARLAGALRDRIAHGEPRAPLPHHPSTNSRQSARRRSRAPDAARDE